MIKFHFYIIFFLLFIFSSNANEVHDLYRSQQYDSVISIHEKLISDNYYSDILYYNTANAYLRKGDTIKALLYYYKSFQINPNLEECEYNFRLIEKKLLLENNFSEQGFSLWFKKMIAGYSQNFWVILFIISFNIIFTILLFFKFKKLSLTSWSKIILFFLFILSTFSFFASIVNDQMIHAHPYSMNLNTNIVVKSEPSTNSTDLKKLKAGEIFKIVDENTDWYKITTGNTINGWVPKKDIVKI